MKTNCHVLLVDDEPDFRESAGLLLSMDGFKVSYASEGREALDLLASGHDPHVILMDNRMPGLTGTDTLRLLRERGVNVPVLLVSAVRDIHLLAEEHRFDGAIAKPFSPEHLRQLIVDVLRRRGVACAQAHPAT